MNAGYKPTINVSGVDLALSGNASFRKKAGPHDTDHSRGKTVNKAAKVTWLAVAAIIAIVVISLLLAKRNADNNDTDAQKPPSMDRKR